MWLADAASSSGPGTITVAIITAFSAVLTAVALGYFTLRGSSKSANTERATEFDKRVDQELDESRARVLALEQQRAEAERAFAQERMALQREILDLTNRLVYAKYVLAEHQIDPRILDDPEAGSGRRTH